MASHSSGTDNEDRQQTSEHRSGNGSDSDFGWGDALLDSPDHPEPEVGSPAGEAAIESSGEATEDELDPRVSDHSRKTGPPSSPTRDGTSPRVASPEARGSTRASPKAREGALGVREGALGERVGALKVSEGAPPAPDAVRKVAQEPRETRRRLQIAACRQLAQPRPLTRTSKSRAGRKTTTG